MEPSGGKERIRSALRRICHHLGGHTNNEIRYNTVGGYMITILLLWLIVLVKLFLSGNSELIEGACQGIYSNLKDHPFTDIVMADTCSDGYEELSLGYWPGAIAFCYDSGRIILNFDRTKCLRVSQAVEGRQYDKWKGLSICVKRVTDIKNIAIEGTICPLEYTECSKGACVQGNICPITSVEFSMAPMDNTTTSGSFQTPFGPYLNFKREQGKLPIGSFRLSIGEDTPCLDLKEYSKQTNYKAIKEKAYGCEEYGVLPNYKRIDLDEAISALAGQSWAAEVVKLPKFNDSLSLEKAYLTYAPRLELRDVAECRSANIEGLIAGGSNFTNSSLVTIVTLILVLIALLFGVFKFAKAGSSSKGMLVFLRTCGIVGLIMLIAILVVSRDTRSLRADVSGVQMIQEYKCFVDPQAEKVIADFLSKHESILRIKLMWILMFTLNFIWFVIGLLIDFSFQQ